MYLFGGNCASFSKQSSNFVPDRTFFLYNDMVTNTISNTIKSLRKQYGLTQEELAFKSGVGIRFLRELEQGKPTVRVDKVNQVLGLFSKELAPIDKERAVQ